MSIGKKQTIYFSKFHSHTEYSDYTDTHHWITYFYFHIDAIIWACRLLKTVAKSYIYCTGPRKPYPLLCRWINHSKAQKIMGGPWCAIYWCGAVSLFVTESSSVSIISCSWLLYFFKHLLGTNIKRVLQILCRKAIWWMPFLWIIFKIYISLFEITESNQNLYEWMKEI